MGCSSFHPDQVLSGLFWASACRFLPTTSARRTQYRRFFAAIAHAGPESPTARRRSGRARRKWGPERKGVTWKGFSCLLLPDLRAEGIYERWDGGGGTRGDSARNDFSLQ